MEKSGSESAVDSAREIDGAIRHQLDATPNPEAAARAARLHYTTDAKPGFSRQAVSGGFVYLHPDGSRITDDNLIARIRKLAIPPAYTDVWICRDPNGHLQAVGRDARGRRQYRYHPRWREVRDEAKYSRILMFGRLLPAIRKRVRLDLARPGLKRDKVLAALVMLLERTAIRIGNEEYARTNKSFGLTTLRRRHVRVTGSAVTFDFRAKHGIAWHVELKDRRLAGIVQRLRDIPGQDLFKYLDDDDVEHGIASDDVNAYLRDISGADITAKDFRTWAATKLAAFALCAFETCDSEAKARKNILRAAESVAKVLGNTPSICRKCYIHPCIVDGYLDGSLVAALAAAAAQVLEDTEAGLSAAELAVTAYLDHRLTAGADSSDKIKAGAKALKAVARKTRGRVTPKA